MGEQFDLSAYIDSLGPMTAEQRAVVDDAMTLVARQGGSTAFLRDAALYLTTLVLVGDVATFDDEDTWHLIDTLRHKHHGDGPGPTS
ncbi:hypothetical protein [Cellulosimicrobium cellulans]|uniref:Uncharacterized protein n=1 Tax=Cellulosimicrobium cellulans TaxID=1710 RepID=A0A4Y4E7V6_CELCE|nr:hypothetical protein [Cellulosimicrobium cellulans]GED11588.1 hypothetical protein CCE02nite_35870 [Cellulosimicrobium cellulans]